jgi:hypothetical protein
MRDTVSSVIFTYDPMYQRFADYLGIDEHKRKNYETAKKLALLYDWAQKETGSEKFGKIAQAVDGLRKSSGVTFSGETLVSYLYQKVRIDLDSKRIKKTPEPTKRERYKEAIRGDDTKIKEGREQTEKAQKEDRVAKSQNTRYINKYRDAIPKRKKGRIPSHDYSDSTSEELSV